MTVNSPDAGPIDQATKTDVPSPTTFLQYLQGMGPGIVVVMSWLGTGDFISASVAGANYGYALLWTLLIACPRPVLHRLGDREIPAVQFRRRRDDPGWVSKGVAGVSGLPGPDHLHARVCLLHLPVPGLRNGDRPARRHVPAARGMGALRRSRRHLPLRHLDRHPAQSVPPLAGGPRQHHDDGARLSFLLALIGTGVDFKALVSGLAFALPSGEFGYITAVTTAVALIGAVGGSAANLLYAYLIHDKGWIGPRHRKLQTFDLLFGTFVMFALVLAVWVVAAETLHTSGGTITTERDLATMMEAAIGPAGPPIMWFAIFFTVFNNIVTQPPVFVRMLMEAIYMSRPEREQRIRLAHPDSVASPKATFSRDPMYWKILIPIMTVPVLFSLPGMPGMVVITLLGISFSVLTVPSTMVGLIAMTARRDLMLPSYVNRWWENAILVSIGLVGLWATYQLIVSIVDNVTGG